MTCPLVYALVLPPHSFSKCVFKSEGHTYRPTPPNDVGHHTTKLMQVLIIVTTREWNLSLVILVLSLEILVLKRTVNDTRIGLT